MSYVMTPPWVARRHMMAMAARKGRRGRGYGPGGRFPTGPGLFFAGRPKVGRGDVRAAILHLLAEQPMHWLSEIMHELTERTDGVWQPSPGSVYPTLQQLEDEVSSEPTHKTERRPTPSPTTGGPRSNPQKMLPPGSASVLTFTTGSSPLREVGFAVGAAVMQVGRAGSEVQIDKAKEILEETRRRIFQILAEDETTED